MEVRNAEIVKTKEQLDLESLVENHGDSVYRTCCLYLGDLSLAEDAAQETFLKAFEKQQYFRGESSEKTWLIRIAINTCKNYLRSGWMKKVQVGMSNFPEQPASEDIEQTAIRKEQEEAVLAEIAKLPENYREVIVLYYYNDLRLSEIAELLQIREDAAKTRLVRARAKLAKKIKGVVFCE